MPTFRSVVDGFIAARDYDKATLGRLAFWVDHLSDFELADIKEEHVIYGIY
jgi:hypothetical protein